MIGLLALLLGDVTGVATTAAAAPPTREVPAELIGPELLDKIDRRPPVREDLVVSAEGRVRWAVVRVLNPPARPQSPPPVSVDGVAEGLSYRPHVAVARTGQSVMFRNADPVAHCLSGRPAARGFEVGLPPGASFERTFANPEIVRVRDPVYPWMQMWVVVESRPYVAVTDENGGFRIRDLPPGRYTLEVWHERLAGARAEVEVKGEGDVAVPDFVLEKKQ